MEIILIDHKIEKFISGLDKNTTAKTLRALDLLEEFNYKLNLPYAKKICSNLHELRVRGKIEVRIFYTFYNNKIYLLNGFIKKTNRIPKKYIIKALKKYALLTMYNT